MQYRVRVATSLAAMALSACAFPSLAGASLAWQPPAPQAAPSADEMDKLTAPIALYPDALIAQMLMCAQNPKQVKEVDAWIKSNATIQGTAAQEAAQAKGFEASFIALVPFPQVMNMMATQLDWTTKLGQAFAADKKPVFDSIQRLRAKAKATGNLVSTPQQEVVVKPSSSGGEIIVIQPANPQIVYVPQYNTTTVYTQPPPPAGSTAGAALVGFTTGVIIGAAVNDHNDYYYGWGYHGGSCSSEGWDEYSNYRQDMANDRQQAISSNQGQRQDSRTQNQGQRQDTLTQNQGQRQQNAAAASAGAQSANAQNAAARTTPATSATKYESGNKARAESARGQSSMGTRSGGARSGGGGRR
ncbi:MAG: DUF3300 domain-containing protein [Planctomycetes bacterium]|nr:DUF3300 domain-containing protein [Planctomycetota bacterium]